MARVNKETVSNARMIQARGTPEEIAAVVNGSAPLTTVYKTVRAREVKTKQRVGGGNKIKLPEGRAVSEVVRDGIKLELEGGGLPAAIARRIGIGVQTYVTTRDVLLLSERDDLSRKDAETVRQALQEIDATQRVSKARSAIKPIALRVWGPRGMRLRKSDERRAKQFDDAIEFLKHTCENAIDMVIPHITHSHAETAIRHLSAAEGSLRKLRERIREVQHG
jgi:hypothetical protein